jgi:hypothetical protein
MKRAHVKQLFVNHIKQHLPPGLTENDKIVTIENALARLSDDKYDPINFSKAVSQNLQEDINNSGILSLSATCLNNLLWSHYADGHKGLCLKFTATNNTPFFGLAQPIQYRRNYPMVNMLKHSPEAQVRDFLLTKSVDWRYEQEWRILSTHLDNSGPGCREFPGELLTEVIFGALVEKEDKDEVLGWLSLRKTPVKVSQAKLGVGSYSLNIVPVYERWPARSN